MKACRERFQYAVKFRHVAHLKGIHEDEEAPGLQDAGKFPRDLPAHRRRHLMEKIDRCGDVEAFIGEGKRLSFCYLEFSAAIWLHMLASLIEIGLRQVARRNIETW